VPLKRRERFTHRIEHVPDLANVATSTTELDDLLPLGNGRQTKVLDPRSNRDSRVFSYHCTVFFRTDLDWASCGLMGSSGPG
jgi:hypothetical protein